MATGRRAGAGMGTLPRRRRPSPLPFPSCHRTASARSLLAVRPYLATGASRTDDLCGSGRSVRRIVRSERRFTSLPLDQRDRCTSGDPTQPGQALCAQPSAAVCALLPDHHWPLGRRTAHHPKPALICKALLIIREKNGDKRRSRCHSVIHGVAQKKCDGSDAPHECETHGKKHQDGCKNRGQPQGSTVLHIQAQPRDRSPPCGDACAPRWRATDTT